MPIEDLRCVQCGYVVYGAGEQRCPECGTRFDWDDVRNAARSRRNHLFEHRWLRSPGPSLLRTWWLAAVHPRRLWEQYAIHDPPKVAPLLVFALLQWAVFAVGWHAVGAAAEPAMNSVSQWLFQNDWFHLRQELDGPLRFTYGFHPRRTFMAFMACWYLATFLSFQMFVLTKRRYRIRWRQILRVFVHATAFASFSMAVWCLAEMAVDACLLFNFDWGPFVRNLYQPLGKAVALVGAVVTWAHVWIGYHYFLKTPRGWGTAAMCLVLGYLLAQLAHIYM